MFNRRRNGKLLDDQGPRTSTQVLGIRISAVNIEQTVRIIHRWIEDGVPNYVCVRDVHGIVRCQKDAELRKVHNGAGLVVPDGMPLVWLSRLSGYSGTDRVYGPDLMHATLAAGLERGWRHFFYGGNPGIAHRLAVILSKSYPGLRVAGTICPPFRPLTEREDRDVIDSINLSRADIVWVGLSTPKQERWMATHIGRVQAPVLIGVGAAFDFNSGAKRQAPRWIQRSGFEWLFRTMMEPARLGPRYLQNNPQFLLFLLKQLFLGESFHHNNTKVEGESKKLSTA
jgi:N-acetylglucosaminyldiphosphoundecaprenol N-acetyl-beta-D-mannosaminyltransferase